MIEYYIKIKNKNILCPSLIPMHRETFAAWKIVRVITNFSTSAFQDASGGMPPNASGCIERLLLLGKLYV